MTDLLGDIKNIIDDGYVKGLIQARDLNIAKIDDKIRALQLKKVEIVLGFEDALDGIRKRQSGNTDATAEGM